MMKRFSPWMMTAGRCLIVLFAILVLFWTISRAMYPTAEQREAMAWASCVNWTEVGARTHRKRGRVPWGESTT